MRASLGCATALHERISTVKRFVTSKRVVIGAYLSLAAFLLAHTVNAFVADALRVPPIQSPALASSIPPEPQTDSASALVDVIVTSGLFPLPPGAGDPAGSGRAAEPVAPPLESAKKVALVGTVLGQQGGVMAILEELSTKTQRLYHIGEEVPAVGALSAIEKDRVLFRQGKQEEWLNLVVTQLPHPLLSGVPAAAPVSRPSTPQRRILDRRDIDAALADPTRLITQAQAVPHLTDGRLDGFRLYSVMPLGYFDKIGLQNNDLLQRINGVEIRDPGILLSLFRQLRSERTVRVDLVRNEQRQILTYEIR
jgi:general secretion pathway protein C